MDTHEQKHNEPDLTNQTPNNRDTKVDDVKNIKLTRKPPKLEKETWLKYNDEFKLINQSSWNSLKKGKVSPEQFVTNINDELSRFLESKNEFQEESKTYFKHNPTKPTKVEEARKMKIALSKKAKEPEATDQEKTDAKQAIRMHNYLLKINKEKSAASLARKEEKLYKTDFW